MIVVQVWRENLEVELHLCSDATAARAGGGYRGGTGGLRRFAANDEQTPVIRDRAVRESG